MKRREHTREPDRVKARRKSIFVAVLALFIAACAGSTGTIGAVLGQRPDGRLFVRGVPPHLAAAERGVRPGDEVLLIDGRDVRQMSAREVHHALEGDVGDTVKLTLVRGNEVFRVTLRLTPAARMPEASSSPDARR